jgi:hypothetical protein
LAELAGRPADSLAFLDRALEVTPAQSVDRLRLQVAWLGVVRRNRLDLAAEVGDEAGDVLDTALRSVGFDAHKSGDVPGALADLADSPERTGRVVDLLRLDQDPRVRSSGGLRDAVLSDYRSEADAAYRGVDQSDELRWDGPS